MITTNSAEVLNRIKGQIYIGNSAAANNFPLLRTHKITHVLICCSELPPAFPDKFEYKKLNIQETFDFNIAEYFAEAYEFIENTVKSGGAVFLHCNQGQSRSPTLAASYLMKRYRMSYKNALKFIKKKHPITEPNVGFVEQLASYDGFLSKNTGGMTCASCNCLIQ